MTYTPSDEITHATFSGTLSVRQIFTTRIAKEFITNAKATPTKTGRRARKTVFKRKNTASYFQKQNIIRIIANTVRIISLTGRKGFLGIR